MLIVINAIAKNIFDLGTYFLKRINVLHPFYTKYYWLLAQYYKDYINFGRSFLSKNTNRLITTYY